MNQDNNSTNSFVVNPDQYVYQGVGNLDKSNSCLFGEGIPSSCDIPIIQMVPHPLESDIPQHSRISFPSQSIPSFQFTQVSYDGGLLYQGGMQLRGYGSNVWTPNPNHLINSEIPSSTQSCATNPHLLPEDAQYYIEIQRFLETREAPLGSTEKYKAHLTERSEHYQIIDGFLYHGKKKPRKVIMRKEEQMELLQKNHVIGDTGVHRGVKKMFTILKDQAFWRGMYRDIVKFVKACSKCFDTSQPSQEVTDVFKEESLSNCEKSIQTTSAIWKNIEVGLYQFPHVTKSGNDSLLTLCDPESLYLAGWAIKSSKDSDKVLSSHIVSALALLGLPSKITITALRPVLASELSAQLLNLAPDNQVQVLDGPLTTPWLPQLLNIYISSKPGYWDRDLEAYLFEWCSGKGSKEETWSSPFSQMFSRRYPSFTDSDDKENINDQLLNSCASDDDVDTLNVDEVSTVSSNVGKGNTNSKRKAAFKPPHQDVKSTVKEVKAILSETKESRRRRGKYQKYHPEIQELMTEFAIKKGSLSASQIFSKVLRTRVSESTIRNLIRAQLNLHPLLKAEIGKYAYEHGPDKACRVYSSKLHTNLPVNLVRKLQMIYFTRLTRKKNEEAAERRLKIETLSEKVKYDIGFFASTHSNQETVRHFMEKGIDIDEEVVKEVVKYLRPNAYPILENHEPSSQENMSLAELLKHPLLKDSDQSTDVGSTSSGATHSQTNKHSRNSEPLQSNELFLINPGIEAFLEGQNCSNSAKQSKNRDVSKKRGQYSSYSPELRAEIGKFAAEHGPLKASVHFTSLLGREIPESTARGLKDKYLKKAKSQPVTSLGYGQRGRPLRLGKYDEAVQDCLRELVRSGEKVTSFLAITTAKKIVSKYEPDLLKENGGPIDLNVSWAKSFLKRIGVSNKS